MKGAHFAGSVVLSIWPFTMLLSVPFLNGKGNSSLNTIFAFLFCIDCKQVLLEMIF